MFQAVTLGVTVFRKPLEPGYNFTVRLFWIHTIKKENLSNISDTSVFHGNLWIQNLCPYSLDRSEGGPSLCPFTALRLRRESQIATSTSLLQVIDIRLAVLGNVDTGKSTLLGVLAHGELDNGRGRARLNLFRHLHEIQSGRTSSISHEILGFNSRGEVSIQQCKK